MIFDLLKSKLPAGTSNFFRRSNSGEKSWILLNDTKVIEGNHLGSGAVTDYIRTTIATAGFRHLGSANDEKELVKFRHALRRPDLSLVVFNGEGSLHSGRPRLLELLEFCAAAKAAGKRTALINSVWQNNPPEFGKYLRYFDIVCVRESRSYEEIKSIRPDARVVPDLTFSALRLSDGEIRSPAESPMGVIDSVHSHVSEALYKFSRKHDLPFFTMGFLGNRFDGRQYRMRNGDVFPQVLESCALTSVDRCITGRFHGLISLFLSRKRCLALPSNTFKIEAMLDDIGISRQVLLDTSWIELDQNRQLDFAERRFLEWNEACWDRIETYKDNARRQISDLFGDICSLA